MTRATAGNIDLPASDDGGAAPTPPGQAMPMSAPLTVPAPMTIATGSANTSTPANKAASLGQRDFGALVDRLLEARAAAQSTHSPQQISTSINHADFGRISLTFRQDNGGLSVSMGSSDPGFTRAAQSAMATAPAHDSVSKDTVMSQLLAGQAGGGAQPGSSGQPSALGQSWPHPGTPAQADPGATGQPASGFAPRGGGAAQSGSQSHPQSPQRPEQIAAARPAPAAPGVTGDTATIGQGIFA